MKKLTLTVLTLLTTGAVYALPLGNPADPALYCEGLICDGPLFDFCDTASFRIGFYGDYVYNRHMEEHEKDYNDIEHTELWTNAGLFAVNICDRIDLFATFGATNIFIETDGKTFVKEREAACQRFEIETETYWSWSAGARGILWECGCTTLGAEVQYFYTRPDIRRISLRSQRIIEVTADPTGMVACAYPDDKVDLKYREWQFGLGVAHHIACLTPYAGIKWSHAKIDMDGAEVLLRTPRVDGFVGDVTATLYDLENKKDFGYAIGVTFAPCGSIAITAEGRFSDEKALHVNGQVRF